MTFSPTIATDLITPLAAYLRVRALGRASFLLESVERGRLGRHSFVGCGSRLVSLEEAEALGEPVVGYLAYDHVARLEPTVTLPEDGPDFPESRFVVADVLLRFDHAQGHAEVLYGDPGEVADALAREPEALVTDCYKGGPLERFPDQATYERGVRAAQEHIRIGDAFQIVLSQRAVRPTSASALDLYR